METVNITHTMKGTKGASILLGQHTEIEGSEKSTYQSKNRDSSKKAEKQGKAKQQQTLWRLKNAACCYRQNKKEHPKGIKESCVYGRRA